MTITLDDVDRLAREIGNYTGTVEQMVVRRRNALRTVQDRAVEAVADWFVQDTMLITADRIRVALAGARKPVHPRADVERNNAIEHTQTMLIEMADNSVEAYAAEARDALAAYRAQLEPEPDA